MQPTDAYLELFSEPGFSQPLCTVRLQDASRLASVSSFGGAVRSVRAYGPEGIGFRLWRYANARGEAMEWGLPASGSLEVDEQELVEAGLDGTVSAIDWFIDGALPWHHHPAITIARVID